MAPEPANTPPTDPGRRLDALIAVYTAERADVITLMGHALALISLAIAYAVGAAAVWATHPDIDKAFVALAPLPLWAAAGFHVLLNGLVFAHNGSIRTLEDILLIDYGQVAPGDRGGIGAVAGERVTNLPELWTPRQWPFALVTLLAYGGALVVVAGFTLVCALTARDESWAWALWLYVLPAAIVAAAWIRVLSIGPDTIKTWTPKTSE